MPEKGTSRSMVGGKPRQSPKIPCDCITNRTVLNISALVIFCDCILVRISSMGLTKVTAKMRADIPAISGTSIGISRLWGEPFTGDRYL